MNKFFSITIFALLSSLIIGCGNQGQTSSLALSQWSESSKSCGNNPDVDELVLKCLNVEHSLRKNNYESLNLFIEDCLMGSFNVFYGDVGSLPVVKYQQTLTDMNNLQFDYLDGATTCSNVYQR